MLILVRILPDCPCLPVTWNRLGRRAAIRRQHQGTLVAEALSIARAAIPPVCSGVDHGPPTRRMMVLVDKIVDPSDHLGMAQAITCRSVGVVLDIQHPGQCAVIVAPSAAVLQEEFGLRAARGLVRAGKMVSATEKAGLGGASVVRVEDGVFVGRAFSSL
jgi:hypothetical protein